MKKLGFGLMRLPLLEAQNNKSIDKEQVKKMIDTFLERGFTYFDTAYMYHDFESERIAKELLVERHPRDSFTLASKMPMSLIKEEGQVDPIFKEQMEKCGVDFFDYYLLHNLGTVNYEKAVKFHVFEYLAKKREEGYIKHLGFSFHDRASVLDKILTEHPEVEFVQLQINYLDWEDRNIQSRLCYETARKHGKEVIVMEPVKGGTLAKLPEKAEKMFKEYNSEASCPSYAIRFAAEKEGVMMVLSGMSSMEQLLDNTSYMADFKPLTEKEEEMVAQAVKYIRESIAVPCTACGYCTAGCPQNIPIPKYFELYNLELVSLNNGFSTQGEYYDNLWESGYGKASSCVACGQCEEQCPQHIGIIKALRRVKGAFE